MPIVKSHRQQAKAELAAVATIPKDWPIQSAPIEDFGEDATAYQPGSLVQACSGTDITLARTAVVAPHVGKQKGKYLLILPGMLSLKQSVASIQLQSSKESSTTEELALAPLLTQGKDDEEKDSDNDKNDATDNNNNKDQDEDSKKPAAVAVTVTSKPPPEDSKSQDASSNKSNNNNAEQPVTLGRVEKLATDAPILRVPFPNGRTLLFPGKKVHTSSKFFMLTCNTRRGRGGSVACKVSYLSYLS
jgi:hypothetical protein